MPPFALPFSPFTTWNKKRLLVLLATLPPSPSHYTHMIEGVITLACLYFRSACNSNIFANVF